MLGARLLNLREKKGLSQSEIAKAIHLTQQAIDNYEKGAREPKGEILAKLARFYGVTTDYLLGLSDSVFATPDPASEDDFYVVFRGRRQELSPEYKRLLISMLEAVHKESQGTGER